MWVRNLLLSRLRQVDGVGSAAVDQGVSGGVPPAGVSLEACRSSWAELHGGEQSDFPALLAFLAYIEMHFRTSSEFWAGFVLKVRSRSVEWLGYGLFEVSRVALGVVR